MGEQEQMGLYERLLEERAEGQRRRGGGPLPPRRGSGSKVLDRRLGNPPKDRPPGYAADLATMRRLITKGPGAPGRGSVYMARAVGGPYLLLLLRRKADRSRRGQRA
jgi:hypothetical protein